MQIADYIRTEVVQPRLKTFGCLVLYDPARRYRDLAHSFASDEITVIDASDSSIESREVASHALRALAGKGANARLLIYVPAPRPVTNEQKQVNPFSLYGECGAVFPDDDSEEYQSLCIRAKPEYESEIRQKFRETADPSFKVIDAIGGGTRWPQLRTLLDAESATDIVIAILDPTADQQAALKNSAGWQDELRDLLKSVLGMALVTRAKQRDTIADEVWRTILFSEFVFDLPGELPAALATVPKAPQEARTAVEAICDLLRKHGDHRDRYIAVAETVERDLNLRAACAGIEDLGVRDTFPFETKTFLLRAIASIKSGDLDDARNLVARSKQSVWRQRDETVQQWDAVESALTLVQACEDVGPELTDATRSIEKLIELYTLRLREVDRAHRALERAAMIDVDDTVDAVLTHARKRYRDQMESVQAAFLKLVEQSGWPVAGVLENAAVFDKIVAPMLEEKGHRVVLLVVDALRYELGAELHKEIPDAEIELKAACALLPTITPVGMASLLPGAATGLELGFEDGTLVPRLGGSPVKNVTQRMAVLAGRYGDRFREMSLSDFLQKKKQTISQTVDLLVLRTTEIDSILENDATNGVKLIPTLLKDLSTAIAKVRKLGFRDVVVVTDHGFMLNGAAEAGDLCAKLTTGTWHYEHDRIALGDGEGDAHSFSLPAQKLGVRASFSRVAGPRSLAPYRAGVSFFHGGLSLQEALVPVLKVRFTGEELSEEPPVSVSIARKGGASRKVTSRVVVVVVSAAKSDLFAPDATIELRIDAVAKNEQVVGEPRPNLQMDLSTNVLTLETGKQCEVTMRMSEEFEGKFQVRVLNPRTMAAYGVLDLETSYTV